MTYCISTDVKENAIKWHVQKALVHLNCKLFLKSNYCIRNQKHSVKMQDYSFRQRTTQSGLLSCNTGPVWEEGAGGGEEREKDSLCMQEGAGPRNIYKANMGDLFLINKTFT